MCTHGELGFALEDRGGVRFGCFLELHTEVAIPVCYKVISLVVYVANFNNKSPISARPVTPINDNGEGGLIIEGLDWVGRLPSPRKTTENGNQQINILFETYNGDPDTSKFGSKAIRGGGSTAFKSSNCCISKERPV